jgi:hypothetical protein
MAKEMAFSMLSINSISIFVVGKKLYFDSAKGWGFWQ